MDTEIIVVSPAGQPADKTATTLFNRLRGLGADVTKVATALEDADTVAAEVRSSLLRRPRVLALLGGEPTVVGQGVAKGADRAMAGRFPAGATVLDNGGLSLLVARTYVFALPGGPAEFEAAWQGDVAACLAEWLGRPTHVKGELVVLDGGGPVVERLLANLAEQHPEVYLRAEPAEQGGIRVSALASIHGHAGADLVDMALSAVERAASASRLRVASTDRHPARVINPSAIGPEA